MGWDYQSLRDASFQRSANWNALFDPSTGQFDTSYSVAGDDEVHLNVRLRRGQRLRSHERLVLYYNALYLSGYEYHPTNTNLWKLPLEETLEELLPLDYLDTTGDSPRSTAPSSGDQSDDSSDGGDLDDYAGDYQGDVSGEEEGGSSGGVYYTAYSGLGPVTAWAAPSTAGGATPLFGPCDRSPKALVASLLSAMPCVVAFGSPPILAAKVRACFALSKLTEASDGKTMLCVMGETTAFQR
ncbi:MAG: hypothetical protein KatS3mg111_1356 [Pirellulaceae bacterium]|nr:MAG: hypothetical protein KatS3mg111_1356 [Pirellulaceae bacterium]